MSLNLPAVIGVPPVPPPAPSVPLVPIKKIVILHTIDIPSADLANFQSYGSVVLYDVSVEGKTAIDQLIFDYLFLDLRNQSDRAYYDCSDLSNYSVVCYCSFIEVYDSFIESLGATVVLTAFPQRSHYVSDFNASLLVSPTPSPSKCISLINFLNSFLASLRASSVKS